MADVFHWFGGGVQFDAGGDLLMATGQTETDQRVVRRLMTAPQAYLWQLPYGAGLPSLVGEPAREAAIRNAMLAQIFEEDAVARLPEPTVSFQADATGRAVAIIIYTDAISGQQSTLPLQLGPNANAA